MSTSFNSRFSAFSILWLRAYDFGLEEESLVHAVPHLRRCPFVQALRHVANPDEIDEVDSRMFDIRYQERSRLVRVHFYPCYLVDQDLGLWRQLTALIAVNLLLDLASGFGVFNLSLPHMEAQGDKAFVVEEIWYLTRQWLLAQDDLGQPQRLRLQLPLSDQVVNLYIREVMNFYFLQTHNMLWNIVKPDQYSPLQNLTDFEAWLAVSCETDPVGCTSLRELNRLGFTRSLFPTSFGPVVDIWGIEGIDPTQFDAEIFSNQYASEIAWLFTDGQRTTLGERVQNQRLAKSLALYIWPNHALYINQNLKSIGADRARHRIERYGCLDVEIIRILEILNLQSALLHAIDDFLDQQLEKLSTLAASDQQAVIKLTEQRRRMSHSTRSFDFYNLFHTAYWESLYARLLDHPHLRLRDAASLVDMKLARLDEEVQQAIIIQDRARQQQQRDQELNVLRGLHSLSLANDVQSSALLTINFLVSATASFGFTQILAPWLTSITGAQPTFSDAYPILWIGVNVAVFLLIALLLTNVSSSIIRRESRVIELEGRLDLALDYTRLQNYYVRHPGLTYLHLNSDDLSGYLRVKKPSGIVVFEFDRERIYRYSIFLQGRKSFDSEQIRESYVDAEIQALRDNQVIK